MSTELAGLLASELRASPAMSVERRQISVALENSVYLFPQKEIVEAASLLINPKFISTLRFDDFSLCPFTWIEFDPSVRTDSCRLPSPPKTSGFLFLLNPENPEYVSFMTSWKDEHNSLGFSANLAHFNIGDIRKLRPSSLDDLLDAVKFGMPEGLYEDMRLWASISSFSREEEIKKWSAWRTMVDLPLALSMIVLFGSIGVDLQEIDDLRDNEPGKLRISETKDLGFIGWVAKKFSKEGGIWRAPLISKNIWVNPQSLGNSSAFSG
jgi:hypothetical protein